MATDNYGTYTFSHPTGLYVNIYYIDVVSSIVNLQSLNNYITDIDSNIKKYIPNAFKGLTLNIWSPLRSDCPKNVTVYNSATNTETIVSYGIKNYAGLTWQTLNKIDLNAIYCMPDRELSNLLSHECSHWISGLVGYDNNSSFNIIRPEWLSKRGIDFRQDTPEAEMIAEDYRIFYGSSLAQGMERGSYRQATQIRGYRDMLAVWKPCNDFIKQKIDSGYRVFQQNVSYKYSDTDFNYFGIQFCLERTINNNTTISKEWYWLDSRGIWQWCVINNAWQWKKIKDFI